MKLKMTLASVAAVAALSVPAFAAPQSSGFSALQGVDAQALSVEEMQAITGELNALDIAAALTAKAATLDAFPKLQDAVLRLAAFYTTNADAINALFMKLGVYTAPK
jgi:protein-disulfide isomerase